MFKFLWFKFKVYRKVDPAGIVFKNLGDTWVRNKEWVDEAIRYAKVEDEKAYYQRLVE